MKCDGHLHVNRRNPAPAVMYKTLLTNGMNYLMTGAEILPFNWEGLEVHNDGMLHAM